MLNLLSRITKKEEAQKLSLKSCANFIAILKSWTNNVKSISEEQGNLTVAYKQVKNTKPDTNVLKPECIYKQVLHN